MSGNAATFPIGTIAKLLMLTDRRVQQLVTEGVLPKAERGRYELVPVVQGYIRYLRDRAIPGDAADAGGPGGIASDKGRLVKAEADIAEMKAAQMRGDLISVQAFTPEIERAVAAARARLLSVPSKLAPVLRPDRPEMARGLLERAMLEVLAELQTMLDDEHEGDELEPAA